MGFNFNPSGDGPTTAFTVIQTPSGTSPTATGEDTLTLASDGSVTISGNSSTDTITFTANGIATMRSKPSADVTTTLDTASDVTGMSFAVAANTTYSFEINMTTGCSGSAGIKFTITAPSGSSVRASCHGLNTGSTAQRSDQISVLGTLTGAFNALAASGGYLRIYGSISTSSTAGTFQLQFASTTAGQTSTVFKESFLQAWSESWSSTAPVGANNSFTTFVTDSGTSPVADATNDSIQFTSTDLSIVGDATLDKITITAPNKVTGPASATDNAVARFDATTGKIVQNSAVIIDDTGNATGIASATISGATGNTLVVDTNTLVADATNNRVGVGTASPSTIFHISGAQPLVRFQQTGSGTSAVATGMQGVEMLVSGLNTTAKYGLALKWMSTDVDFTTTNPKLLAMMVSRATENYGADTQGGTALDFFTTANNAGVATVPTVRMSIDHDGEVGIGTETPIAKLDVSHATAATTSGVQVQHTDNTSGSSHARFAATVAGTSGGDPYSFYSVTGGSTWSAGIDNSDSDKYKISSGAPVGTNAVMTMDTSGNVGIGNESPANPLDVLKAQNAATLVTVVNTTDGTASTAAIQLQSDNNAGAASRTATLQLAGESHSSLAGKAQLVTSNVPEININAVPGSTAGTNALTFSLNSVQKGRYYGSCHELTLVAGCNHSKFQATVNTTDATATQLLTFATASNTSYTFTIRVTARRTGGASGAAGDSGGWIYFGRVKNVAGVLTLGLTDALLSDADQAWTIAVDVSGTNLRTRVTGTASNNVTWTGTLEIDSA